MSLMVIRTNIYIVQCSFETNLQDTAIMTFMKNHPILLANSCVCMCVALKNIIIQRYKLKDTRLFSVVMDPWHTGMFVAVAGHNYGVTVHRVFQNIT